MRFSNPGSSSSRWLLLLACAPAACESKAPAPAGHTQASPDDARVAEPPEQSVEADGERPTARPIMIEFSRDYCTPCQIMKPWVDELALEHPGIDVVTVNVDRERNETLGSYFKVSAVPSLVFVNAKGTILTRWDGLASKEKMSAFLQELGWVP